jgi:transglutaminase/protease-like cytokinesis protein 3
MYKKTIYVYLQAPSKLKSDLLGLVEYLISPYDENIDKVRSIFRWITRHITYDVKGFFSGQTAPDESFLEVMCTMKATCKGYCKLFSEMCR